MQQIYEVIIIGAGISGVGASKVLTASGVPHIILQSRDRYGGRIYPNTFAGLQVDIGATFVHCPKKNNLIAKFMKEEQCEAMSALINSEHYYYQDEGPLKQKFIDEANELFEDAIESVQKKVDHLNNDISIAEAVGDFMRKELSQEDKHVQDTVFWRLNIEANTEGVELSDMSAKAYCEQETNRQDDLVPLGGGYPAIFEKLFKTCKGNVILNTRVVSIDMTGNLIVLRTNDNRIFQAKRVISSIPLGILQRNLIHWNPPLPQPYQRSIMSIGNGIANKLFCSFKEPFWGKRKGWINFVLKGQKYNKYPVAFIYPEPKNHILVVFVSGRASLELGQWSDEQIYKDFDEFISLFLDDDEYDLEQVKLTRWHLDEHAFGSYSYYKVGTTKQHYQQLRQPIQNRFWFIGEHTHPESFAFAHGAYETGIWAAQEALKQ